MLPGGTCGARLRSAAEARARRLDAEQRAGRRALFDGEAAGNAVVVRQLLAERGIEVELRTLQRALAPHRQARRAAEVATVRFETAPGHQMQIDFGEKRVVIAGQRVRVLLVRRRARLFAPLFVRAFLQPAHDDWREGLAAAFRHFGGVTQTMLVDNARALVLGRDRATRLVHVHPAFDAFCRDWGVTRARLPPVPRAHQRQDRVGRQLREAQRARRPRLRVASPRSRRTSRAG